MRLAQYIQSPAASKRKLPGKCWHLPALFLAQPVLGSPSLFPKAAMICSQPGMRMLWKITRRTWPVGTNSKNQNPFVNHTCKGTNSIQMPSGVVLPGGGRTQARRFSLAAYFPTCLLLSIQHAGKQGVHAKHVLVGPATWLRGSQNSKSNTMKQLNTLHAHPPSDSQTCWTALTHSKTTHKVMEAFLLRVGPNPWARKK